MAIITLMTDFGIKDGNVGVMKGIILSIAPGVQLVDLSHTIQPQNVNEAALILARSAPYFPAGTVHLVVVDPGVGTERRPMAACIGAPDAAQYYVLPDNGVLTPLLERAEAQHWPVALVHLDRPAFWLPTVSYVFHGRDIFAPVAAHLASGIPLDQLGSPLPDPVRLSLPHPERTSQGWLAEIIHIDHFGNISTSLRREDLGGEFVGEPGQVQIRLCGVEIDGLVHTFGDRPPGTLAAMYGSTGSLIICEINGSAAFRLGARIGDRVEVLLQA